MFNEFIFDHIFQQKFTTNVPFTLFMIEKCKQRIAKLTWTI